MTQDISMGLANVLVGELGSGDYRLDFDGRGTVNGATTRVWRAIADDYFELVSVTKTEYPHAIADVPQMRGRYTRFEYLLSVLGAELVRVNFVLSRDLASGADAHLPRNVAAVFGAITRVAQSTSAVPADAKDVARVLDQRRQMRAQKVHPGHGK